MKTISIYDTTLRDGTQAEGVSLSLLDKIHIAQRLAEIGIDLIEGGFPYSNPKDQEFFQRMRATPLHGARLCAFGMTRRRGVIASEDPG
ncbi:MAG: citramalate synthase, partial [Pirellulaceae bacterium]